MRPVILTMLLAGCLQSAQNGNEAAAREWGTWHADKQRVELAMSGALNDGSRPDFARAIAILRASDWPQPIKDMQGGMMVLQSYETAGAIRPSDTVEQGLMLVERAALAAGETSEEAPQQLRMVFERGLGRLPNGIAADPVIADCWHGLEGRWDGKKVVRSASDPATCVALRRRRLPHPGR